MNYFIIYLVSIITFAEYGLAFERVEMRGLQDGPVGRGAAFAWIYNTEIEATYFNEISEGSARGSSSSLSGQSVCQKVDLAAAYDVNKSVHFVSFANFTSQRSDFSTDRGLDYSLSRDRSFFEFGAGPSLNVDGLIFGGYVSVLHFNEETSELELENRSASHSTPQATLPFLSLHGGIGSDLMSFVLGLRVFNQTKVEKEITDQDGKTSYVDTNRSRPGEVWVDLLSHISESLLFSLSVTVITTSQSSETINNETIGILDPKVEVNNEKRNANQFNLAFGGAYQANKRISLLSSLRYVSPSFAKTEYASLSEENLGGYKISVGSNLELDKFHLNFLAGYLIPKSENYTVNDSSATPWAVQGEKISIEQPKWTISVGTSLPL